MKHKSHAPYKTAITMEVDWCQCCGIHFHLRDQQGRIFACAVPEDIDAVVAEIAKAREERRRSAS